MVTSIEQFEKELFQEHQEEAAFLYEQRLSIMFDDSIAWTALGDFEARREAHMEALLIGGTSTLRSCIRQAMETQEPGDLYVASLLACRLVNEEALASFCGGAKPDEDGVRAMTDALVQALPGEWLPSLLEVAMENPSITPVFIHVIGQRKISGHDQWLDSCRREAGNHLALCHAYTRLVATSAASWLEQLLMHEGDQEVRVWAAIALLTFPVHARVLDFLRTDLEVSPWKWLPLGLAGSASDVARFELCLNSSNLYLAEGYRALGLLGEASSVPFLLDQLGDENHAPHAAGALNLMLGAELYEEVFVPAQPDPDEFNEEEMAMWERGETPLEPCGNPPGQVETRIVQDKNIWQQWWLANEPHFCSGRFRHGEACQPLVLVTGMKEMGTPNLARQWNALELAIRYKVALHLDIYAPVTLQWQQIHVYEAQMGHVSLATGAEA